MTNDPYNGNGVKKRLDGRGDGWAEAHRTALPRDAYIQDGDALFGALIVGQNTSERLFFEYVPDAYQPQRTRLRKFAYIALFDRKRTIKWARSPDNSVCTALYLDLCRRLAADQPRPPRFFWVCGEQTPPWLMYELDTSTGEEIGVPYEITSATRWEALWQRLGLTALRAELKAFVDPVIRRA